MIYQYQQMQSHQMQMQQSQQQMNQSQQQMQSSNVGFILPPMNIEVLGNIGFNE
jgi:hypothetical protein